MKFKFVITLALLLSSMAHARVMGGQDGNGGDGVLNQAGTARFLDQVRSADSILDIEQMGYDADLLAQLLKNPGYREVTYFPEFAGVTRNITEEIMRALKSLTFYETSRPLAETHDRGDVKFPFNFKGKIVRLALQSRSKRIVLINSEIFRKLSRQDQVALILHETLIRVYSDGPGQQNLSDTSKIAALVKATFSDTSSLTPRTVSRYLCDAGIMTSPEAHFGLRRALPLYNENLIYPKKVLIFSYQDNLCKTADLESRNNGMPDHPRGQSTTWEFSMKSMDGREASLDIFLDKRSPHSSLIATALAAESPSGFRDAIVETDEQALSMYFSVWVSPQDPEREGPGR